MTDKAQVLTEAFPLIGAFVMSLFILVLLSLLNL